jgi:hypothetical protein
MEWQQTHGNHVFDVVDTFPPILLQPLPRAHPPQLRCYQPPVKGEGKEGRRSRETKKIQYTHKEETQPLPPE